MRNNAVVPVLWALVVAFGAALLVRIVVLSQAGVPGGWVFFLGLPLGGIGALTLLLLRLGLLHFGEKPSAKAKGESREWVKPPQ